ncbi:acyltransferase family protein [Corynebacterium freneyi]|uniref:acyltransferase family protein n=1 Tax=Corynebacterium freneyi TaxID=134034 RepID=UPI001EF294C7|nr:acyltransferase family protein [Corynebacterium freneyi]MCG7439062.1 acyltransferase [Corynebacterium freneyi]
MTTAHASTGAYRHDLDGLRGLAIALVVVFHVFDGRVSGGVDVFLLLSGFFFLGSQMRNADRGDRSINVWHSLWRTIRRLLPSLIVVVAATTAGVLAFAPALINGEIAAQLPASLLYVQNIVLADQGADYAAASAQVSPLQHLWSMSVQGQFYLFGILIVSTIAFVLRATHARPRVATVMAPLLVAATVASFWYATVLHGQDQGQNYYSTWSRMWELAAGGLLALAVARFATPRLIAPALPVLGVAMIVSTGFLFDGAAEFPGPWTLWPLGGAALVILGGGAGFMSRFLESGFMTTLGDLAYALYLWHWPLLIISMSALGLDEVDAGIGTAVIAASLGLAWLTHRFVEKPLMQKALRPLVGERRLRAGLRSLATGPGATRAVAAVVLVAMYGSLLGLGQEYTRRAEASAATHLDPIAYPGARALSDGYPVPRGLEPRPAPEYVGDAYPITAEEGCMTYADEEPTHMADGKRFGPGAGQPCVYGDPHGKRTMFLIGSSHSEQWSSVLDRIARDRGWRLIPVTRQGCVITLDTPLHGSDDDCIEWSKNVLGRIAFERPDLVVTTSTRARGDWGEGTDELAPGMAAAFRFLDDEGIPMVGLRSNPWLVDDDGTPTNAPECLAERKVNWRDDADAAEAAEACGIARDEGLADRDPAARLLDGFDLGWSIDMSDAICLPDHCPAVVGNIIVYRDSNHLSVAYADSLQPLLARELEPIFDELERR